MRWVLGVACIVTLWIAPAAARAQAPILGDATAERAAIHTQLDVATGTYVASAVLGIGGVIALPIGLIGWATAAPDDDVSALFGLFVAGMVALPLGLILLAFAIGLHVDADLRRGRLDARASVASGPGDLGLSIAIAL